jgi:hypothetical protein
MIAFARDRVPLVLLLLALLALLTAAFLRPAPLPAGAARLLTARTAGPLDARTLNPSGLPSPGLSYAFDVLFAGSAHIMLGTKPVSVAGIGTVGVAGWALDPQTMEPGRAVLASLDGRAPLQRATAYGVKRPDVASALSDPAALASGFRVDISLAGAQPGLHRIMFVVIAHDGRRTTLPTSVEILVR